MGRTKADLLIHPVRLQIVLILSRSSALSTAEIAHELSDVPKSSIYRHLQKLLEGGMVKVERTRQVRGVQEKYYALAETPHLSSEDVTGFTKQDHVRTFTTFTATLIRDFNSYIQHSVKLDLAEDRTGYNVVEVYATTEELDDFGKAFGESIQKLVKNEPLKDRNLHKLVLISHPLKRGGESDG
ncbi:MAG: helix-turn-helix domain-containing protein [Anaerolineales bacterium]|nr:helix-turn-helix domain-containing protein [Anaerolineales bacterium]